MSEELAPRFETRKVMLGPQNQNGHCPPLLLPEASEKALTALKAESLRKEASFTSSFSEKLLHNFPPHIWRLVDSPSQASIFSELPPEGKWSEIGVGDLNGDLRPDLLFHGGRFFGWWATFGSRYGGLSRSVSGIDFPASGTGHFLLLDMDCDGSDDLIEIPNSPSESLTVAFSRFSKGISDVLVTAGSGQSCTTDIHGECFLSGEKDSFRLSKEGFLIEEAGEQKAFQKQFQEIVTFTATPLPPNSQQNGQRFSIAPQAEGPYVCLGFSPGDSVSLWRRMSSECPEGHALMGVSLPKDNTRWALSSIPRWVCCPLPAKDILLEEKRRGNPECPEDSVAVGAEPGWGCPSCPQKLICQTINSARYKLGEPFPGTYWGFGRFQDRNSRQVLRSDIPVALRFAFGRTGVRTWDEDGCLGYPWGSLLTRMPDARSCDKAIFRTLLHSSATDKGVRTTPLKMFPDCAAIDDPQSPFGKCRSEGK